MKQHNQIGKYTTKDEILLAKKGKTFITPSNNSYVFDFKKEGRKYIFIIDFKGFKMQINEPDFNKTPIDTLLNVMQQSINDL